MSFLDGLLGGIMGCPSFSPHPAPQSRLEGEEMARRRQYEEGLQVCTHSNCPICKRQADTQAKLSKKKKEDYDRRVKDWREFRRINWTRR